MDPMSMVALGGSLAGALGSMFAPGKEASYGMTAPQVVTMPTYTHQEPTLRSAADWIQKSFADLQEGQLPQWWSKLQQPVRQGMQRGVKEAYFGSPGLQSQGIMDMARSSGALMGTGPKATQARENKAMNDYATRLQQVEEMLAQSSLGFGQQLSQYLPNQAGYIGSISPPAQMVGGVPYQTPEETSPWAALMGAGLNALPWLSNKTQIPNPLSYSSGGYGNTAYPGGTVGWDPVKSVQGQYGLNDWLGVRTPQNYSNALTY